MGSFCSPGCVVQCIVKFALKIYVLSTRALGEIYFPILNLNYGITYLKTLKRKGLVWSRL